MKGDIKKQAISGFYWSAVEKLFQQFLTIVISIYLARLLAPGDFGLMAILTFFIAISQTITDGGFGQAIVQKERLTEDELSSVFYLNILIGCILFAILCSIAPFVGAFYDEQLLSTILYFLATNVIISSTSVVHLSLLVRKLDFKSQLIASIWATLTSGILAITLAHYGYGVWSLVAQSLSFAATRMVALWVLSDWRPRGNFRISALTDLFGYGSNLLAASLIEVVFRNAYYLVIGKVYNPATLGFYFKAQEIQSQPTLAISSIINRVAFPLFSKMNSDPDRRQHAINQSLALSCFFIFPMMTGTIVVAENLIVALLTEKWLPSKTYLQLFCGVGIMYALSSINATALTASGHANVFLKIEIYKKIVMVAVLLVTINLGIVAVVVGQVIVAVLSYFINAFFVEKFVGYKILNQIQDVSTIAICSIGMSVAVSFCRYLPIESTHILLLVQVTTGLIAYAILCYVMSVPAFNRISTELLSRLRLAFPSTK